MLDWVLNTSLNIIFSFFIWFQDYICKILMHVVVTFENNLSGLSGTKRGFF